MRTRRYSRPRRKGITLTVNQRLRSLRKISCHRSLRASYVKITAATAMAASW